MLAQREVVGCCGSGMGEEKLAKVERRDLCSV